MNKIYNAIFAIVILIYTYFCIETFGSNDVINIYKGIPKDSTLYVTMLGLFNITIPILYLIDNNHYLKPNSGPLSVIRIANKNKILFEILKQLTYISVSYELLKILFYFILGGEIENHYKVFIFMVVSNLLFIVSLLILQNILECVFDNIVSIAIVIITIIFMIPLSNLLLSENSDGIIKYLSPMNIVMAGRYTETENINNHFIISSTAYLLLIVGIEIFILYKLLKKKDWI